MRKHTKIYFDHFGYDESDFISCEVCGAKAVDLHHINCRGMGGSKKKDFIENIQALCRSCHLKFGDKKQYIDFLQNIHNSVLEKYGQKSKRNKYG